MTRFRNQIPVILRFTVGLTFLCAPLFAVAVLGVVLLRPNAEVALNPRNDNCLNCHDQIPANEAFLRAVLLMSDPHGLYGPTLPVYWYADLRVAAEPEDWPRNEELQAGSGNRSNFGILGRALRAAGEHSPENIGKAEGPLEESADAVPREVHVVDTGLQGLY